MPGLSPARSWTRVPACAAVALVAVTSLSGCKGIDKSQWRDISLPSIDTSTSTSTAARGSTVGQQNQQVDPSDDSGVIGGAPRGHRRSSTDTVAVATDPTTCWVLVVDGDYNRGCGNTTVDDMYGTSAGRVTKLSGGAPILLTLRNSTGHTISSGQVVSDDHYVTVLG